MLIPSWIVPPTIKAVCFDKNDTESSRLYLPHAPTLLKQVHGQHVIKLPAAEGIEADGSYSQTPGSICAIKTADCLAIYLSSQSIPEIALLHGGWRGLSQDIIASGCAHFKSERRDIVAYLGPAISAIHYEIGVEVYDAFCHKDPSLSHAFQASRPGHYFCDLYAIARHQLRQQGIEAIYGGEHCTFREEARFHSFRREGQLAGRLLHCLWIE